MVTINYFTFNVYTVVNDLILSVYIYIHTFKLYTQLYEVPQMYRTEIVFSTINVQFN